MTIFEGNTVEEAIQTGLKQLGISRDAAEIKVIEEAKKGFLGLGKKNAQVSIDKKAVAEQPTVAEETVASSVEVKAVTPLQAASNVAETSEAKVLEDLDDEAALTELALYLTNISKELGAPALVRMSRDNSLITMHLDSDKQGLLIGKHGKVLNALQYLAQVFVHRAAANKISVVVNVGDYREKRQVILERLAERTAEKVKQTRRPVFLEPMPAFERKQIHSVLSHKDYVQTHSEGEEPYRYLVVEPVRKLY
ncbi:spoIIIJ-associated protein [Enterococcus sp. PF1-24]|uniref:RNA-binding cell elongation regulator Jag/EloR n=1 Tax=unclassified Enterococcus TaxID=2608891 RepID=UPI002475BFC7|nr:MULTISPECIES: RNA-binding cell elongation regulator Jag/EloR [unclassified Enterococcus]MDH6364346.1 spoIIIJ-associated protein [Enterococcus sp. PFB1-1]MDH6401465.1 spoIIIJ-associated protein [Enterococcus sp. PF1-24]